MSKLVTIVKTGVANIASVEAGFNRLGAETLVTRSAEKISAADYLILPGVGTFSAGMQSLRENKIDSVLRERVLADRPTMAICLGLQLLFESSEESPGEQGLGILEGTIGSFPNDVKVPHFGWNHLEADSDCKIFESGYAYFANSFRLSSKPEGWATVHTSYGETFISGLERGSVVAGQFHPELSGEWGQSFMKRWLQLSPK